MTDYQFIPNSGSVLRWNDDGTKTEIDRSMTADWSAYETWQATSGLSLLRPAPDTPYVDALCMATREGGKAVDGITFDTDMDSMGQMARLSAWSTLHPASTFYIDSIGGVLALGQMSLQGVFDTIMTFTNDTMSLHAQILTDIASASPTIITQDQVDKIFSQGSMTPLPGLRG